MAQKIAKEKGYSDVLYLDAVHKKYLEEVSSCNIFVIKVRLLTRFYFGWIFVLAGPVILSSES